MHEGAGRVTAWSVPLQNRQYVLKHHLQGVGSAIHGFPLRGQRCAMPSNGMSHGVFPFCNGRRGGRRRERRRGQGAVGGHGR